MRTPFALLACLLAAACSGSSSSNLFGPPATETKPATPEEADEDAEPAADGGKGSTSSSPGRDASAPEVFTSTPCNRDSECLDTNLCNLRLDRCAAPGPDGTPCSRDVECESNLCNLRLDQCARKGAAGVPCSRDSECVTALCNLRIDQCSTKGATGAPCSRDSECASGKCNTATDVCL